MQMPVVPSTEIAEATAVVVHAPLLDVGGAVLDRTELQVGLREAIRVGDAAQLDRIADAFGDPLPLPVRLTRACGSVKSMGDPSARAVVQGVLSEVQKRLSARCLAGSREAASGGSAHGDLLEEFKSHGRATPNLSAYLAYFISEAGEDICLRLGTEAAAGIAVHVLGYVHSSQSDGFAVSIVDAAREATETLRIGMTGITLVSQRSFAEMTGSECRLYSLLVSQETVSVYINGLLQWRHRRVGEYRPTAVEMSLKQIAGRISDFVLCGFAVHAFEGAAGEIFGLETADAQDRLGWYIRNRQPKAIYGLCRSIFDVELGGHEPAALTYMSELASAQNGYLEWTVEALRERLSLEGRAKWQARAAALLPRPIISASDLTVSLKTNKLKSMLLSNLLFGKDESFLVLDSLNFDVYPGDVVGVVGRNGAGKTTLLRTLAGLIPIARGRLSVVDDFMLLRPGVGINSYLSGRENVISAGVHMGMTPKEAEQLVPDVLEVSELGDHFERPVKYYSDGMMSRLVFAIATSVSPDLLLLDELLGAGDLGFQKKAQARLDKFLKSTKSVMLVTHSIDFVRQHCTKALVLSHGRQVYFGEPGTAISAYLDELNLALSTEETGTRF